LSKITNGQLLEDGECEVVSGPKGLDSILKNLWKRRELSFDAGAFPFKEWPPMDPIVPFAQPKRLAFSEPNVLLDKKPETKEVKNHLCGCLLHSNVFVFFDSDTPLLVKHRNLWSQIFKILERE
jgi:hypothetical protein